MRLTPAQIATIKSTAQAVLGTGAQVHLFGSRVDEAKRGGDIDLYISGTHLDLQTQIEAKLKLLVNLKQRLGDQRIDIVFAPSGDQALQPIHCMAVQSAMRL